MPSQLYFRDESKIKMPNIFENVDRAGLRKAQALAQTSAPVKGEQFREVKLSAVVGDSPLQMRAPFSPEHNDEDRALVESLASDGQRVPVLLVETGDDARVTYTILDGHRRLAALRHVGRETVKAIIVRQETLECDLIALTANVRKHLTPLEQAHAVARLRERHELTLENIARKVGLSRRYVTELVALLETDSAIQAALENGSIKAKTALALGQAPREYQSELAEIAAANRLSETEAKRYVTRLKETGETPAKAALALGFTPSEKELTNQQSEKVLAASSVEDPSLVSQRKLIPTRGRKRSESALTPEMAMALIKSSLPELDERTAKFLAEQAVKQSANTPVLKTAGLLVLAGSTVDKSLEIAWLIAHTASIQKLVHISDVFVDLYSLARRGHCLPEWAPILVALAKKAAGLKQVVTPIKRPNASNQKSSPGQPQKGAKARASE